MVLADAEFVRPRSTVALEKVCLAGVETLALLGGSCVTEQEVVLLLRLPELLTETASDVLVRLAGDGYLLVRLLGLRQRRPLLLELLRSLLGDVESVHRSGSADSHRVCLILDQLGGLRRIKDCGNSVAWVQSVVPLPDVALRLWSVEVLVVCDLRSRRELGR